MPLIDTLIARASAADPVLLASAAASIAAGCAVCTAAYRLLLHPLAKIPGPKHMAVADLVMLWHLYIKFDSASFAAELHRKYGPVVRIGPDRVLVSVEVAWSQVYGVRAGAGGAGEFGKTKNFLCPFDHLALIGASYEDHRRQRRHMSHAFSTAALTEQEHIIVQHVDKLVTRIKERATRGETLDIVAWINYCVFDVVGDLSFGDSFHGLDGNTDFVDNTFLALEGKAYMRFWKRYPWLKAPMQLLMDTKKVEVAMAAGKANSALGVAKAKERMARGPLEDGRRDFATYMLKEGKDGQRLLSTAEVESLSSLFVGAGSETAGTALSGFVFFTSLPENAEKRAVLVDEILSAFPDEDDIDLKGAAQLEYLRAAIDETMRLYPPALSLTPRVSPGAEVGGYWFPQGSIIHSFTPATYHDPAHFQEPNSFIPERWLKPSHPRYDPRFESDHKDIFRPFSTGARDCIGKNLAYAEMNLIASRFLYNFEFELLPGGENWMRTQRDSLLWLKSDLKVRVKLRNEK